MPVDWFAYPQGCWHHASETTDLTIPVSLGVAYHVAFLVRFTNTLQETFVVAAIIVTGCYTIPKL